MTLLRRPSIHLNKSLPRLKVAFYETAQINFLSPKFDNVSSTFFLKSAGSKISSLLEPTRTMTLLRRPSIHLNKSLTRLKVAFYENVQINFLSPKFDNVSSTFFRKSAGSKISSLLEPTRTMTLLRRPSIHLNKSLTRLKVAFYENVQINFLSPKFDNVLSTFFVIQLDQKKARFQNPLGL